MLPRTKIQIQNSWLAWLDQRAIDYALTDVQKSNLKLKLANEVDWMIRSFDFEQNLQLRLNKINSLLSAHDNDLTSFDADWQARKDFLEWMQT